MPGFVQQIISHPGNKKCFWIEYEHKFQFTIITQANELEYMFLHTGAGNIFHIAAQGGGSRGWPKQTSSKTSRNLTKEKVETIQNDGKYAEKMVAVTYKTFLVVGCTLEKFLFPHCFVRIGCQWSSWLFFRIFCTFLQYLYKP